MPRTSKDKVDYFPHDANASTASDTLKVLQGQFGNDGYAFWFKLLEKLASSEGHYIDIRKPTRKQVFQADMGVDEITTMNILNILVEMEAIDKELCDVGVIWCQKLVNNLSDVYKNRRREIPQKPIITGGNPITTVENGKLSVETPISTEQSKVKYSKVKYSKVDNKTNTHQKYGEFENVLLSSKEYDKLKERLGEAGARDLIERLSAYMKSRNKRYSSHYATILNWARSDGDKGKSGGSYGKDRGIPGNRPAGAFSDLES